MTVHCVQCGQKREIECTEAEYKAWRGGTRIQDAMPRTPAEQRELLISGICGACFDKMFKEEDEELGDH